MRSQTGFGLLFALMAATLFAVVGVAVLPQSLAAQSGGSGIAREPVSLPDTTPDLDGLAPQEAPRVQGVLLGAFMGASLGGFTGFVFYEAAMEECAPRSTGTGSSFPFYFECNTPTQARFTAYSALGGGVIGALVGSLRSGHGPSSQWSVLPSGEGRVTLRCSSLRAPGGRGEACTPSRPSGNLDVAGPPRPPPCPGGGNARGAGPGAADRRGHPFHHAAIRTGGLGESESSIQHCRSRAPASHQTELIFLPRRSDPRRASRPSSQRNRP